MAFVMGRRAPDGEKVLLSLPQLLPIFVLSGDGNDPLDKQTRTGAFHVGRLMFNQKTNLIGPSRARRPSEENGISSQLLDICKWHQMLILR